VTTLFGNAAVASRAGIKPARKHGWLPLLIILFLISYGLMTMLIVEQGAQIESQRVLIRDLFRDSAELSAFRTKVAKDQAQATATKTQAAGTQNLTQNPSAQAPARQAPSSQAAPQHRAQSPAASQKQYQMPSRPASDLADERRALISI
jgi:hypothetical protein